MNTGKFLILFAFSSVFPYGHSGIFRTPVCRVSLKVKEAMTASGKIQKYKLTEMAETIWPESGEEIQNQT